MHNKMHNKMYNSIILSSCLFGSYYLFSISLQLINKTLLEDKKIPVKLMLLNGFTFGMFGFMVVYSIKYSQKILKN